MRHGRDLGAIRSAASWILILIKRWRSDGCHSIFERAHNNRTASYPLGMPQLSDFPEDALSAFGGSCEEFEIGHL
jgi:hypothetical protein